MNIEKKELEKSQIELSVELTLTEFEPNIGKAVKKISQEIKIDGFRPGYAPYEVLKKKIGEMAILEEAARFAITGIINNIIKEHVGEEAIGRPQIDITKLAPGNPLGVKIIVSILPKITLGKYKELEIKREKITVSDDEIAKILDEMQEMRVQEKIVDRVIADGDKVLVDIQMFLDNVPIDGGQSQGTTLIIGKNYIIPGFDKHLLGLEKNATKEFSLPYPNDHHMKNIAGKMVEFKITVKEIYERVLPALDDSFALSFGQKTFLDIKENISKGIAKEKEKANDIKTEKMILDKILEDSKIGEIAEDLIKHEGDKILNELEEIIMNQGGKFEDYLKSINKTENQLTLELLPDAVKRIKVSLLIKEVGKLENIKASAEKIKKQINEIKNYYQELAKKDPEAKKFLKTIDTPEYETYVRNALNSREIIDKLKEWNITV